MNPVIIDFIGTSKGLVKRALKEVLLLLGILMFGLSAPLLFTLGVRFVREAQCQAVALERCAANAHGRIFAPKGRRWTHDHN
jgi:hypothetical protein